MNTTITLLTTHEFKKTSNPTPTSVQFTDISRGIDKPDTLRFAYTTQKNGVESGSLDQLGNVSLQYTYVNGDGVTKKGQYSIGYRIPDDMSGTDVANMRDLLMAYFFSAKTDSATNIAEFQNRVIA